jgi:CBS domain-containing protein
MKGSIMTEKIRRRGVITPEAYEADILRYATAGDLMSPIPEGQLPLPAVNEADDLSVCAQLMGQNAVTALLVLDKEDGKTIKGIVQARDILKYYSEQKQAEQLYDSPARTRRWMVRTRRVIRRQPA